MKLWVFKSVTYKLTHKRTTYYFIIEYEDISDYSSMNMILILLLEMWQELYKSQLNSLQMYIIFNL